MNDGFDHGTLQLSAKAKYPSGNLHSNHTLTLTWQHETDGYHYTITTDDDIGYTTEGVCSGMGSLWFRLVEIGNGKIYGGV